MQTIDDIFRVWPSTTVMAEEIGEKPDTVFRWSKRGRIPEHAWGAVIESARRRKQRITAKQILDLNAPMRPRGAGSPLHPNHNRDGDDGRP